MPYNLLLVTLIALCCMHLFRSLCCFFLLLIPVSSMTEDLPAIGTPTSGFTHSQEIILGQAWLRSLRRHVSTDENFLLLDYLNDKMNHLTRYVDLDDLPITTVVINNPELNAFAVAGGIIGINNGLLNYVETEDELVSVLAHELGHLYQRHFARIQENNRRLTTLQISSLIAGILLMQADSDLGTATIFAGTAGAVTNNLGYSRSMEREADRVGLNILSDAGYSPGAMTSMLENMMRSQTLAGDLPPEYMMTHPITQNRIAETQTYANSKKAVNPRASLPFEIQKTRIKIRSLPATGDLFAEINNQLKKANTSEQKAGSHYGLALLHARKKDWEASLKEIETALNYFPDSRELLIAQADIFAQLGKLEEASSMCNKLLDLSPHTLTESSLCAEIAILQGDDARALQLYRKLSRSYPHIPRIWKSLTSLEEKLDNKFQAYRANNEFLWTSGNERKAMRQLEVALKDNQWKGQQRSRIADRLDDMRYKVNSLKF